MGDSDLVSAKGIYPYSYMTGPEKLAETQLSPIETFYNTLKDESCPLQKYDQMRKIWVHYNMKTIKKNITITTFFRTLSCWRRFSKFKKFGLRTALSRPPPRFNHSFTCMGVRLKIYHLTRGSAPGPRWGLCPQTPVIGSCAALAMAPQTPSAAYDPRASSPPHLF